MEKEYGWYDECNMDPDATIYFLLGLLQWTDQKHKPLE